MKSESPAGLRRHDPLHRRLRRYFRGEAGIPSEQQSTERENVAFESRMIVK
jgi:hypothetical protein